jgi:Cu-Zn family superoxide dismutase
MKHIPTTVAALAIAGLAVVQAQTPPAKAELKNAQGQTVGTATLTETPHGVLIRVALTGVPKGAHAFHIHDVGRCEPPFTTAGGHFNPGKAQHGIQNPKGMHAGDLPNVHVQDGLELEVLAANVTLAAGPASVFDADGSALVVHEGADDYSTDPAGNAGARHACGIISK